MGGCAFAAAAIGASFVIGQRGVRTDEQQRLDLLGGVLAAQIETDLGAIDRALADVVTDHLAAPGGPSAQADLARRLRALANAMPGARAFVVLDGDGIVVAADKADLLGRNLADRDYFRAAKARAPDALLHLSAPLRSVRGDIVVVATRSAGSAGSSAPMAGALVLATLDPAYFGALFKPLLSSPDLRVRLTYGATEWLRYPQAASAARAVPAAPGASAARLVVRRAVAADGVRAAQPLTVELSRDSAALDAELRDELAAQLAALAALALAGAAILAWSHRRRAQLAGVERARDDERAAADAQLARVLRGANMGLWRWSLADNALHLDRHGVAAARTGGAVRVGGQAWRARIHPDDVAARDEALSRCAEGAAAAGYDVRYRLGDGAGGWTWLREQGQVSARGADGAIVELEGTHTDVTRAAQAELAIAHERAQLETVFEHLGEAVILFDGEQRIVRANRAGRSLHGLFDEAGATADALAISADAGARIRADLALARPDGSVLTAEQWPSLRALRGEFLRDEELEMRRLSTGRVVVAEFTTAPLRDSRGAARFVMTCRDVTERHLSRALRSSEARFRTLIEDAPLAIAILRRGHFVYTNPRYRMLHGYARAEDLNALPWRAMLSPASNALLMAQEGLIVADSDLEQQFEALGLCKGGALVPVFKTTTRVELSDGPATLVFAQDISAQKHAEGAMLLARNAAEAASRSKADFLANMSHEIRSPLNGVLGLAYLLEQQRLPAEALDMVRRIRTAGVSLLGIINDILDVSKIEAGHMRIEHAPFRLADVVERLADSMGIAAANKRIALIIEPLPEDVDALAGDALRLEQVLVNLTSNAIKFTEAGQVALRCHVIGRGDGDVTLGFEVADSGIGIAPEVQADMFSPFTQADGSTTRRFGGTGLGLAISRQLVALMGGVIGVDSTPGEGSVFRFSIVCGDLSAAAPVRAPQDALDVLIADASVPSRVALGALARSLGWQASLFETGAAALAQLAARAPQAAPALLLLDWQAATLAQLAAAHDARAAHAPAPCAVLLMSSAYGAAQLAGEPAGALVDAVLTKPVTGSALFNAVQEARRRAAGAGCAEAAPALEHVLAGARVLVVDDSELNRDVVGRILAQHGAAISCAADGQGALDWLALHADAVDVVLMDVQMPGMDGLEATRRLRRDPRFDTLPVVALTAGAFQSQQAEALAAGMDYFVGKPFDIPAMIALVARVRRAAAGTAGTAGTAAAAGPVGPAGAAGADGEGTPTAAEPVAAARAGTPVEVLDVEQGMAIWSDADVYRSYLAWFVREHGADVDAIDARLAAGEVPAARALAHKLAGVAGNLGLRHTLLAAGDVEMALAQGRDSADAVARLAQAMRQALAAIAALDPVGALAGAVQVG